MSVRLRPAAPRWKSQCLAPPSAARGSPPAKNPKGGGAALLKTAKEPGEKHRLEPYFVETEKKNFNHLDF